MGLFASLIPYLILYPTAISRCPLSLVRSCCAWFSPAPSRLVAVCVGVYRIRQDPAVSPHLPCRPGPRTALTALITMQWGGWPVSQTQYRSGAAGYPITTSQHRDYLQGNGKEGVNHSSPEKKPKNIRAAVPKGENWEGGKKKVQLCGAFQVALWLQQQWQQRQQRRS